MRETFSRIYADGAWAVAEGEPLSGVGSTLEATSEYRMLVEGYLCKRDRFRTVVDIGCGDWTFSQFIAWGSAFYIGLEVVPGLVRGLRLQHRERSRVAFFECDVTQSKLPCGDLVLVKDVLQHWPNETIRRFIPRLACYQHVLLTNTVEDCGRGVNGENEDCEAGGFRPLDLHLPPFNLRAECLLSYWVNGADGVSKQRKEVLRLRQSDA